jgi:metallophosphoesterase superfamily enzyme
MEIRVHTDWLLTPYRLAIHEPTNTAVIADVHLGYREARQHTGDAVPLLDVGAQLAPLRQARQRCTFDTLIVAGDLFERGVDRGVLDQFLAELASLNITFAGLTPGNHDRGSEALQNIVPLHTEGVMLGAWRIVHQEPVAAPADPAPARASDSDRLVLGHWHPAVRHKGRRVPCYLVGPQRIILPAFSADAAGVTMSDQPPWRDCQRYAISAGQVVAV